jgi:hypothetical protein
MVEKAKVIMPLGRLPRRKTWGLRGLGLEGLGGLKAWRPTGRAVPWLG